MIGDWVFADQSYSGTGLSGSSVHARVSRPRREEAADAVQPAGGDDPFSKHEAPAPSVQCGHSVIRLEPVPIADDDAPPNRRHRARVALEHSGLQRREDELTERGWFQRSLVQHPLP
jgi:hypothetical protein